MRALKKPRLSERAAEEIKQYIKQEQLQKRDRLPSVSELIDALGIGRSTLREALQLLESQGTLEILNGKGTFVRDTNPYQIQTSFDITNEKHFLLEALEVRSALEGKAVELAAKYATEEEIEKMEYYLQEYVRFLKLDDRDNANHSDSMFHQMIYDASKNELLKSIIESVWDSFHEFWNEPFGKQDIFDQSYPHHETLLLAIQNKEPIQAQQAFTKIMHSVRTSIENI
ncbi:FadR family transcriptional regulator [Radiobacillus kanasensis]|uniref:FadR/GntR family transcriptional regulator n=1 Tax=Radiobacillus kanasensis TaxID=2844358 RepID=UPI001E3215C3|nr:FadR/GntR family transcriptional regulator [Radiobacillus kanasensis]UFU00439.1 FadR family transcriptional regulator [Radiobacillus kanasensis]